MELRRIESFETSAEPTKAEPLNGLVKALTN